MDFVKRLLATLARALFWIVGFGLFCVEYGPILTRERKPLKA